MGRVQVDNRLAKQLETYVPVVVAARGTEQVQERKSGEDAGKRVADDKNFNPVALAADQFIASKVLHQLRSRFEVTTDGIQRLEQSLDLCWSDMFPDAQPTRCHKMLADQRRRRNA